MIYSDLHCDTVTRCVEGNEAFAEATGHIRTEEIKKFRSYRQCFALFADDSKRGGAAFSYCKRLLDFYKKEIEVLSSDGFMPVATAENGALLGNDSSNVHFLADEGVRMLGLTWNGENDLAAGCSCDSGGLKSFGREVIRLMEKRGLFIDVSHLNEKSFYDVASFTATPLIASHSNCFSVTPHRRNLKDEQLKIIIASGGLIGLCFHSLFLECEGADCLEALYRNIYHILSLGGENAISFGGDFDGGEPDKALDSLEKVIVLRDYLEKRGIGASLLDKIFFSNAEKFFM